MNRLSLVSVNTGFFPWAVFGCFLAANGVLSYFPLALEARLLIAAAGLLLPAVLALRTGGKKVDLIKSAILGDFFPKIPPAGWALLALASVFLRFHQLTTLSLWPLEDEAMNGHYAIELAERGAWQLTYDFSGMPPLYVWGLGVFFKLFGISLVTLWFFPALLSTLAVGFLFAGSRYFFSKSFSFLLAGIWAVSFWPLYVGRFSVQGGFLIFWACLTFYWLGIFWQARKENSKLKSAFFLGLVSGCGFYTFTSWAIMAFLLTLFVFSVTAGGKAKEWRRFLYFFVPEVFLFFILAWATLTERGGHFRYVVQNPLGAGWPGLNDFCALFWGSRLTPNLFAYRPFWGGFLNPWLGALCFWGAIVLSKAGSSFWKQFIILFILILPGFLTGGLDGHRVVQSMPFLLFAAAVGLTSLLLTVPPAKRILLAGAVLLFSGGLDARHLFGVYHSLWTQPRDNWFASKSVERLRAFTLLEKLNREEGPGYVLSDLVPDIFDQTLSVAAYPFDAVQNPKIARDECHWAALLINVNFQGYLTRQFPEARWFWLASDVGAPNGGLMLGLLPLPSSHPEVLSRYLLADRVSHSLAGEVYDNHDWKSSKPILKSLAGFYPAFKGDPFLESCFWEKFAETEYHERDFDAQVGAYQKAVAQGIPAAHLFNDLGALYLRRGSLAKAGENFKKALDCRPNHTSAAAGLASLESVEKGGAKLKD